MSVIYSILKSWLETFWWSGCYILYRQVRT